MGEADVERQGCSHTFYSGLFACLIAVCVRVPAEHAGGLMHDVIVWLCLCMAVCACVFVHTCVCLSSVWKVLLSTG